MQERRIETPEGLDTLVDEVLSILPQKENAHVLALKGELGAGKTAFTQRLAARLGVVEHVASPTFVIMKTYETKHDTWKQLVHIDAYRVEDVREMEVLHIDEQFASPGTIVCIEWPENIQERIPADAPLITFTPQEDGSRIVTYG